ncbi:hypothetical protein SAY86_013122 [Trapa natans]|uniref:acid phosphatase n=1 Tax=Trapa natans TaxID=22666 RepID=A0AAN7MDZ2_TRANT|nr:hypothetical protein SAY86_013122 [Trapa natans]
MGFEKHRDAYHALVLCLLAVWSLAPEPVDGGITSNWVRDANLSADMPLWSDVFRVPPGYNAPQQVHITQGDYVGKGVIISWITPDEPGSNTVVYWAENSTVKSRAEGIVLTYTYYNYTSGYIHHCTIERLEYDTKYYYEVGIGNTTRAFWFITPPGLGPDIPYNFGLIVMNMLGDQGEDKPFKPYTYRFHVPYGASWSTAPFWYSIKRASAHIIVMASYSSYVKHYMEGETMRVMYEPWFVEYKVDVVFAGHVHAYERSERISNIAYNIVNGECTPRSDESAPVYITIGDGGNLEGLATEFTEPQPSYSAFREASFGHGMLEIKNRTHAFFSWHRNEDEIAVEADSAWLLNRYWHSLKEPSPYKDCSLKPDLSSLVYNS